MKICFTCAEAITRTASLAKETLRSSTNGSWGVNVMFGTESEANDAIPMFEAFCWIRTVKQVLHSNVFRFWKECQINNTNHSVLFYMQYMIWSLHFKVTYQIKRNLTDIFQELVYVLTFLFHFFNLFLNKVHKINNNKKTILDAQMPGF